MRALITGGSGYFGSRLVRFLQEAGERCRVFDLVDASDRSEEVEFFPGDIRDPETISRACQGIDVVFHNIAQVPLAKDRHLFESVNIGGTRNLLEACRKAGTTKVIYTSSSAVFGVPRSNPVTEETPPTPMESYGRAKYEGERLCRRFVEEGMDITIIRPRTILGHGRLGIFQILFEWVRTGYNIPVLGEGKNIYQFVHADDLAGACLLAAGRKGPALYNCGAKSFGTMRATLEALCRHAGTGSKVVSLPLTPTVIMMKLTGTLGLSPLGDYHALMYGRSLYFDITRAQRELGWQPKYSSEEMMAQSYDWYLMNRDSLGASPSSPHRSAVRQGILNLVKHLL